MWVKELSLLVGCLLLLFFAFSYIKSGRPLKIIHGIVYLIAVFCMVWFSIQDMFLQEHAAATQAAAAPAEEATAKGYAYETGKGVPQDYAQAMTWYRKGADGGNVYAQAEIGYLYEAGHGVPQDYAQASAWY